MTRVPMQHYIDDLDAKLRDAGEREQARSWPAKAGREVRSHPVGVGTTAGALAVVAVVAVAATATGPGVGQAQAMPVLHRAPAHFSSLSAAVRHDVRIKGSLREARAIAVPAGTAYVVPGNSTTDWCLTLPDAATAKPQAEYAVSCVSQTIATNQGVALATSGGGSASLVAVIPDDVAVPTVTYSDGRIERLQVKDGAVSASLRENATVTLHARNGKDQQFLIDVGGSSGTEENPEGFKGSPTPPPGTPGKTGVERPFG